MSKPVPKFKIFQLPSGMWRLSMNAGTDALTADVLWIKGSDTDFVSHYDAKIGMMRLVEKREDFFDADGNLL